MTEPHNEFTALPIAQRALLWCMRMWVLQLRRGTETQARVGNMLGQLGAPSATPHLESLMLALVHGTTRELEVLCVCRTEVAADERALLDEALSRRLRGSVTLSNPAARRRVFAALVRQGFSPEAIMRAIKQRSKG